jgi:serine phosphatase RsbU (regulator of sigma subunit)
MAVKALQGSLIAEQQLQMAEQDRALTLREEALDHQRTLLAIAIAVLLFIGGLLFYTFRLYQDRTRKGLLLARQKDAIEAQRNEIEATALQLSKVYGKLQGSLNYAQRIQRAILPSLDAMRQALPNSFVLFQPREAVSGDFYWFAQKGQKTFLAAIDCTGHGVPGAFMSMIGYALLNEIVVNRGVSKPSAILQFLDMGIRSALRQEGQGPHDGMDMALCCWDRQQHTLQFAGARNPLVYRHEGRLQVVKGDRFSIGQRGTPKSHRFTNHEIPLNGEPMQVFLYSDGFQDQFGGESGEKYLSGRFRKLLDDMAEQPAGQRQALLQQELDRWMEGHAQVDDILVVGFEASSAPLPQAPAQALAATGAGQA